MLTTRDIVAESNRIEGITRPPTKLEIAEHERFVSIGIVTVDDLKRFVSVYQPDAVIRDREGLDVRVGNYVPPRGGPEIPRELSDILAADIDPFITHHRYENLHPFTDCNGRSGRALWWWHMRRSGLRVPEIGFLHSWYYQSLSNRR